MATMEWMGSVMEEMKTVTVRQQQRAARRSGAAIARAWSYPRQASDVPWAAMVAAAQPSSRGSGGGDARSNTRRSARRRASEQAQTSGKAGAQVGWDERQRMSSPAMARAHLPTPAVTVPIPHLAAQPPAIVLPQQVLRTEITFWVDVHF